MSHEFTMKLGGVPAGTYPQAEFIGSEDFSNNFGQAVKLKWRILGRRIRWPGGQPHLLAQHVDQVRPWQVGLLLERFGHRHRRTLPPGRLRWHSRWDSDGGL